MKLSEAILTFGRLPEADCHALLGVLTRREQEAIHSESRLDEAHWHEFLKELELLPAGGATEENVRAAICKAMTHAVLAGPKPVPLSGPCERAVSLKSALARFYRELDLTPKVLNDHINAWSDPANTDALEECRKLIKDKEEEKKKEILTGRNPSWAIPFAPGAPRPLDGCPAGICHQRLALSSDLDDSPKLLMVYELPVGTLQAIPTIGDAYRWDAPPHWRPCFMPAPDGELYGRTAPFASGLDGFPEIVHSPVSLVHLIFPLQARH